MDSSLCVSRCTQTTNTARAARQGRNSTSSQIHRRRMAIFPASPGRQANAYCGGASRHRLTFQRSNPPLYDLPFDEECLVSSTSDRPALTPGQANYVLGRLIDE